MENPASSPNTDETPQVAEPPTIATKTVPRTKEPSPGPRKSTRVSGKHWTVDDFRDAFILDDTCLFFAQAMLFPQAQVMPAIPNRGPFDHLFPQNAQKFLGYSAMLIKEEPPERQQERFKVQLQILLSQTQKALLKARNKTRSAGHEAIADCLVQMWSEAMYSRYVKVCVENGHVTLRASNAIPKRNKGAILEHILFTAPTVDAFDDSSTFEQRFVAEEEHFAHEDRGRAQICVGPLRLRHMFPRNEDHTDQPGCKRCHNLRFVNASRTTASWPSIATRQTFHASRNIERDELFIVHYKGEQHCPCDKSGRPWVHPQPVTVKDKMPVKVEDGEEPPAEGEENEGIADEESSPEDYKEVVSKADVIEEEPGAEGINNNGTEDAIVDDSIEPQSRDGRDDGQDTGHDGDGKAIRQETVEQEADDGTSHGAAAMRVAGFSVISADHGTLEQDGDGGGNGDGDENDDGDEAMAGSDGDDDGEGASGTATGLPDDGDNIANHSDDQSDGNHSNHPLEDGQSDHDEADFDQSDNHTDGLRNNDNQNGVQSSPEDPPSVLEAIQTPAPVNKGGASVAAPPSTKRSRSCEVTLSERGGAQKRVKKEHELLTPTPSASASSQPPPTSHPPSEGVGELTRRLAAEQDAVSENQAADSKSEGQYDQRSALQEEQLKLARGQIEALEIKTRGDDAKIKTLTEDLEAERAAATKATAKMRTAEDFVRIAKELNETLQEKIIQLQRAIEAQNKTTAKAEAEAQDARERITTLMAEKESLADMLAEQVEATAKEKAAAQDSDARASAAEAQTERDQRRVCELEAAQAAEVQSMLDHQAEAEAASERAAQMSAQLEQARGEMAMGKVKAQARIEALERQVVEACQAATLPYRHKIDSLTTKLEDAQREISGLATELEQGRHQSSIELQDEIVTLRQELAHARKERDDKDEAYKRLNKQNGHMAVHYKCLHSAIQKLKAEGVKVDPRAAAAPTIERLHSIVDFTLSEASAGPASGAGVGSRRLG